MSPKSRFVCMDVGSFKCYRTVFIRTSAVIYLGVSIEELLEEEE